MYRLLGRKLLELGGHFTGSIHPLDDQKTTFDDLRIKKYYWGTFIIDLTLDKEKLWLMLDKKSARKNVERAKERGITITKMESSSDLKVYQELLKGTKSMLNLPDLNFADASEEWEYFRNMGQIGFLAWKGEIPLAGISISTFNNYINEWGVARSEYDAENKFYSQDLLKWHIIEWGSENGFNYYDLSGVNPNPKDKKEEGIYLYKKKWGGTFMNYSIYFKE